MEKFLCSCTCSCGKRIEWNGTWETICIENELETIRVTGNGNCFEVILGLSEMGDFLCIPAHDIGFALKGAIDSIYVEKHLSQQLDWKDAVTIATALREKYKKKRR